MKLFIHIQITNHPKEIKFNIPIINYLKKQNADFVIYDIDNHSDSLITHYANQLLLDADKSIVCIEAHPEANFKNLIPLITTILDNPEGKQIILNGENHKLEKMLRIFPYLTMTENTLISELIQPIIEQFFAKKEHL